MGVRRRPCRGAVSTFPRRRHAILMTAELIVIGVGLALRLHVRGTPEPVVLGLGGLPALDDPPLLTSERGKVGCALRQAIQHPAARLGVGDLVRGPGRVQRLIGPIVVVGAHPAPY